MKTLLRNAVFVIGGLESRQREKCVQWNTYFTKHAGKV